MGGILSIDAGLSHGLAQGVVITFRQHGQGQANAGRDQSHLMQHPFHRDGIRLARTSVSCSTGQTLVDGARPARSPATAALHSSCMARGAALAVTEITPFAAQQHQFHGRGIVAAVEIQRSPQRSMISRAAVQIAGRFLDADDVGDRPPDAPRSPAACRRRCGRARCRESGGWAPPPPPPCDGRYRPSWVGLL